MLRCFEGKFSSSMKNSSFRSGSRCFSYSFAVNAISSFDQAPIASKNIVAWSILRNSFATLNVWWKNSSSNWSSGQIQQQRFILHSRPLLSSLSSSELEQMVVKRNRWTEEEDLEILRLAQLANRQQSWTGLPLPKGRTLSACSNRARELYKQTGKDGAPLISSRQAWTKDAEQLVVDVVAALKREKIPWAYIQPVFFPIRSRETVWKRWYLLKPRVDSGELQANPPSKEIQAFLNDLDKKSIARSTLWTDAEDACLLAAVSKHGKKWKLIAKEGFKSINYNSKTDKTLTKKNASQCRHRWRLLDPQFSRQQWTEHEQSRLRDMVIQLYQASSLDLDINAIIERKASWPSDVSLSFGSISKQLAKEGIFRSINSCSAEWFSRSDPSLHTGEWTEEERLKLAEIMKSGGGSLREAWRQLHRPLTDLGVVWAEINKDFDHGPLSDEEQLKILMAIHKLGQFHNRTIRREVLPRRTSRIINAFWRHNQLRVQRTVFEYSNADESIRKECSGKDLSKFFKYFSSLKLGEKDLQKIVDQLTELKR